MTRTLVLFFKIADCLSLLFLLPKRKEKGKQRSLPSIISVLSRVGLFECEDTDNDGENVLCWLPFPEPDASSERAPSPLGTPGESIDL
mmetsp:Transcript_68035/g.133798  ORF Transcript_68035/g.133798 Transcript_68035/m.133798 type:complete len:88 (-) Transcript_68035:385-648(-)